MYKHTQLYCWKIIYFLVAFIFVLNLPDAVINHKIVPMLLGFIAVPFALSFFLRLWKTSADLAIDERGVSETMTGLRLRSRTILWEDIETIKVEQVSLFHRDLRYIFNKKDSAQIRVQISPACWKRLRYTRFSSVGQNVAKGSRPYEVIIPLWDWGTDSPKARSSIKHYYREHRRKSEEE